MSNVVRINITANADQAKRVFGDVDSKVGKLGDKLKNAGQKMATIGAGMTAGLTLPIVALGKASIDAASDLSESLSKAGVVFGTNAGEVEAWSKTAATSLGISQQKALEAAGTYGNLFTSLGLTQGAAADMSTKVVGLSSDLASFNNLDPSDVLEKMRAGLTGEYEPLKSMGIAMNEAAVKTKAWKMGLVGADGKLSESAKIQARYALIMDQTSNAQGDFARTSDGLANKQRIMAARFEDTKAKLGTALMPIMNKVMEVVAKVADAFSRLSPRMQKIAMVIAGVVAVAGPLLTVIGGVVSAIGLVLSPVGLVIAAIAALGIGLYLLWKKNETFRNGIKTAWEWIKSNVPPVVATIVNFIRTKFQAFLEWWRSIWPQVQEAASHVWNVLKGIFNAVLTVLRGYWERFGSTILANAQQVWNVIKTAITVAINIIKNVIQLVLAVINGDWGKAWNAIKGIASNAWKLISQLIRSALNVIKNVLSVALRYILGLFRTIWNAILAVVRTYINAVKAVITAVMNAIKAVLRAIWDTIASIFRGAWEGIKSIVNAGINVVKGYLNTAKAVWSSILNTAFDAPKRAISLAWEGIKNIVQGARLIVEAAISGIKSVASTLAAPFITVKDSIVSAVQSIIDKLQALWDKAKSVKDGVTSALSNLPVVGGLFKSGGDKGTRSIPTNRGPMPRFAGAGGGVTIQVAGSVVTERQLIELVRDGITKNQKRNATSGIR